ncbi:hypothetical protein [Sodalis sp. (in: enterobacteria)]|uniref:hypothetical protein n=1 Tax=Sodalis sp. (in: enterobacteria) TaxID=1898979 RepID=UPI003F68664E
MLACSPPTDGFGGVVAGADLRLAVISDSHGDSWHPAEQLFSAIAAMSLAHQPVHSPHPKNIWAKVRHVSVPSVEREARCKDHEMLFNLDTTRIQETLSLCKQQSLFSY